MPLITPNLWFDTESVEAGESSRRLGLPELRDQKNLPLWRCWSETGRDRADR